MRTVLAACFFLGFASWVAMAQPPATSPPKTGKLVIRPGGSGVEEYRPGGTTPNGERDEKAGFIVIRPGGNGIRNINSTGQPQPPRPTTLTTNDTPKGMLPVPPPEPQPVAGKDDTQKVLFDYWFAVGVDGQRVGYVNWSAKEMEQRGKPFAFGVRYLNLTVSRFGNPVTQWGEESTVETPKGQVLITSMRQGIGKDQALAITGVVEGNKLKITGDGAAAGAQDTPWVDGVVGVVREPQLFREIKQEPGTTFEYVAYIPTVNRVLKNTITYEGTEERALWADEPKRKLLRFTTKPEPIGKVKLPAATTWVDAKTFEPLLQETDFPAFGGRLTMLRTTKDAATAPIAKPLELFNVQSIRLDREIPGIHRKGSIVYKMTITRDDDPGTVFATDSRQQVKNLDAKAGTFEFAVAARHGPDDNVPAEPKPGAEFTESNFFVNSDNDAVKGHAAKAVAQLPATASAWDKAKAVERWVHANMKAFEFSQAMATADNVAKNLSGDCTEYAMLSAAMCRALGIPSRTALGVVYAPAKDGKPFLAYHMWFEVYVEGQWVPLDATLGMGGVGPGHLKITDHSWHNEKSFAPLLPVLRALTAKPAVSVVKVNP